MHLQTTLLLTITLTLTLPLPLPILSIPAPTPPAPTTPSTPLHRLPKRQSLPDLLALASSADPPGWFSGLPADGRGYLHTYQVGVVESEAQGGETASGGLGSLPHSVIGEGGSGSGVGPLVSRLGGRTTGSGTGMGMETETGDFVAQTTGIVQGSGPNLSGLAPVTGGGNGTSAQMTSGGTTSGSRTDSGSAAASDVMQSMSSPSSRASAAGSTSSSTGDAPQETGLLVTGAAAAVGVIGAILVL